MNCERDLDEILKNMNPGEKGCVVFLDLDNFKQVNDGLGHQYGDVLLQEIAYSLQETDGIKNSCYRMGGDEFVIIVKPWYFDKITEIVDKISKRFNEHLAYNGCRLLLHNEYGNSCVSRPGKDC